MLAHDFEPLFKLEHMLKDVRHCLHEARHLGNAMPMARRAEEMYTQADHHDLGGADFAAIVTVVESASGAPPT
jgi:3-hydroxyisobutyrate dehydrogenase-like beta-hydroxyacid dehydrogenase